MEQERADNMLSETFDHISETEKRVERAINRRSMRLLQALEEAPQVLRVEAPASPSDQA